MEQIIEELSELAHQAWRDLTYPNRPNVLHLRFEFQKLGDELININKPYIELNNVWKKVNNKTVNAALFAYSKNHNNRKNAASYIHDEWMKHNEHLKDNIKYAHLFKSYDKLTDIEKEKDALFYDLIKKKVDNNELSLEQINEYINYMITER